MSTDRKPRSYALARRTLRLVPALASLLLFAACASGPAAPPVLDPADASTWPPFEGEIPPHKRVERAEPPTSPSLVDDPANTNVRVNQDASGFPQNETTLAISPIDPALVVAGANDARSGAYTAGYYFSSDGGATWSDGVAPFRKYALAADPTAAFCGDGSALFGYLDYNGAFAPHRLVVMRSSDGGASWDDFGVVYEGSTPFADKPYLDCAPDGGFYGNRAYVSWTHFGVFNAPIRVAWSADRGETWQGATNISGGGVQGSIPVAGRDGAVWIFWKNGLGVGMASSTNGGGTWSAERTIVTFEGIGDSPNFRRNSHPAAALDLSGGPYDGRLYVAYAARDLGDPDIFLTWSDDGVNWSAPLRINDDPVGSGRDQYFPWMAVDERGHVHLMWHDQRADADNVEIEVYIATSRDGGQSFDRNLKVTDVPSDGSRTGFLGDYSALDAGGGRILPFWTDVRAASGETDVYAEVEPAFAYDIVRGGAFEADGETFVFEDQNPRLGPGIVYDALTGNVADLAADDRAALASCVAEDLIEPRVVVTELPAPGEALYVLVRAQGPEGAGSFGSGVDHPDARDGYDAGGPCS